MNPEDTEEFRAWQRREQEARHALIYDKPINPELGAKLDAALLKLGIRPPRKKGK